MEDDVTLNPFHKSIMIVAAVIGAVLSLGGCMLELPGWQTGGEVVPSNRSERRITLDELEKETGSPEEAPEEEGTTAGEDGWQLPENGSFLNELSGYYDYRRLDEKERIWYADMAQALGKMEDKIKLSEAGIEAGLDETRVDRVFQAVLSDHPELFYVEGYNYTKYTRAEKTVAIEFSGNYSMSREMVLARRREIEAEVSRVLEKAPAWHDDYRKVKYVYEYLITETEYDVEAEDNQNIYSVFVRHVSVCQGYAKAFQYLMNRMGVECALVQGKVLETGEGHAWNLVKADGDYYYVDATWGDISYQSDIAQTETAQAELSDISYDYLCVTTKQLLRTHIPGRLEDMPECTAERDNYYVREGALFADYDEEQFAKLVDRRLAKGNRDITLRCADEACYQKMCEALLDRQEIFNYLEGTGINSFVYSCNDQQLTLTFFMVTNKQ